MNEPRIYTAPSERRSEPCVDGATQIGAGGFLRISVGIYWTVKEFGPRTCVHLAVSRLFTSAVEVAHLFVGAPYTDDNSCSDLKYCLN